MNNDLSDFDSLVPGQLFDRRSFLAASLGAGFALTAQAVMAQTAIQTDDKGLLAGEVKIPAAGGEIPAYRAQPAEGKSFPTILVVQEIFGVHEHIRDVCRRLAKLGYQAIAPELYARQGDPSKYASIPDVMTQIVAKVTDAQVLGDLDASAAWAQANGGDAKRLGITGFCWGGRFVWLYAAYNPKLKAGVAWYGRLVGQASELSSRHPVDVVAEFKAPVLGLYAGQDQGIPPGTVEKMRTALKAADNPASKASEIVVFENASHAFNADYRPSYRKEEAESAWQQMQAWFKRYGL